MAEQLTAQQRALLFAANTRQHMNMLGSKSVDGGAQTISFDIPKVRLIQSFRALIEATVNVKGSAAVPISNLDCYKLIRSVRVDLNNGFAPVTASARDLAMLNMLRLHPAIIASAADDSTLAKCPASLAATSGGSDNTVKFMLEIPITLNERDCTGLILAQNAESSISLSFDIANGGEIINNKSGYTVEIKSVKITPEITSFSIPSNANYFPDLSVLKCVNSRTETFPGSGVNHIKLPCGMIYRKVILYLEKSDGTPMTPADISSNLEIVINSADIPYAVKPDMLREMNKSQYGYKFPEGMFIFDWSYQGIPNLGGSRDYVDSESISELLFRFTTTEAGRATVISECLSRLI